jgi:uncharacterized membrane protein
LADLLLFGTFLLWSVLVYKSSRARDRAQAQWQVQASDGSAAAVPEAKMSATIMAVVAGSLLWGGITFYLHTLVVGVSPLG